MARELTSKDISFLKALKSQGVNAQDAYLRLDNVKATLRQQEIDKKEIEPTGREIAQKAFGAPAGGVELAGTVADVTPKGLGERIQTAFQAGRETFEESGARIIESQRAEKAGLQTPTGQLAEQALVGIGTLGKVATGAIGEFFEPELEFIGNVVSKLAPEDLKRDIGVVASELQKVREQLPEETQRRLENTFFGLTGFGEAITAGIAGTPVVRAGKKLVEEGVEKGVKVGVKGKEIAIDKPIALLKKTKESAKEIIDIATGKKDIEIKKKILENTEEAFKDAEIQAETFATSKKRQVETKAELLREFKKQEEFLGEKIEADFSKTKFANEKVQTETIKRFLNNDESKISKADLARNSIKLSELLPTGGQSNFAASNIRKFILNNTSKKFIDLNDTFADLSRAINVVENNQSLKTIKQFKKVSPQLKSQIDKLKTIEDKRKFIENLTDAKTQIGKVMDSEINILESQSLDGETFRKGLENVLEEQNVILTRTPEIKENIRGLEEIIEQNPEDIRVKQFLEDRKIVKALEPRTTAFNLKNIVINKKGIVNIQNVKDLLKQDRPTPEGDLLRDMLQKQDPQFLEDIVRNRFITKKKLDSLQDKILLFVLGTTIGGGIVLLKD